MRTVLPLNQPITSPMPKTPPIKYIFFDIGNVLFNDERQNFLAYLRLHETIMSQGEDWSFSKLMEIRESMVLRGQQWINQKIAQTYLTEDVFQTYRKSLFTELLAAFDENHLFSPATAEMLQSLQKTYRLGIIANQPPEARNSLQRRGILDLFDVIAISDEVGISKPDAGLYRWTLEQVDLPAENCLMVGDRLDNDVAPAQEVGMQTVHLDWHIHTAPEWIVSTENEIAYRSSTTRFPLFMNGRVNLTTPVTPTYTLPSLLDLPTILPH